jgi:glyoxylase-like metal-dependent hydrolase (beta-lactamase superfamily II)
VFLTHNHYDHCSNLSMFENATLVIPERAWTAWHEEPDGAIYLHEGYLAELESLYATGRICLLNQGVVVPSIGVRWVGGHSVCSQFIYVNTTQGVAVFTGDTVQMYGNPTSSPFAATTSSAGVRWTSLARTPTCSFPGTTHWFWNVSPMVSLHNKAN